MARKLKRLRGSEALRLKELLRLYSKSIPVRAFSEWFGFGLTTVRRLQGVLGVSLETNAAKKLYYKWLRLDAVPLLKHLTNDEQLELHLVHGKLVQRNREIIQDRMKRHAQELLEKLEAARASLPRIHRGRKKPNVLIPCSGHCGCSWPRTKTFFSLQPTCHDGLNTRCRYCVLVADQQRALMKSLGIHPRQYRTPGKLSAAERRRMLVILGNHWHEIPVRVLSWWFDRNPSSIRVYFRDLGVGLTESSARTLYLDWCHRESAPQIDGLTASEDKKLFVLWVQLKDEYAGYKYTGEESERKYRDMLRTRRARMRQAVDPPDEQTCEYCDPPESWPKHYLFFKKLRSGRLEKRCLACRNRQERNRTRKKKRERLPV